MEGFLLWKVVDSYLKRQTMVIEIKKILDDNTYLISEL